jgi:HAD superfamily hydrolase (TIGR01509 family)
LLDGWVISSEEHLIKPDVAIYRRLCEKFNLLPEECLFTDDKQVNIDGAMRAGMQAVLFTDAHTFAEYMKQNAIL